MNKTAKRGRPLPDVPDLPKCLLLHAFFVGLDHLFDHLAADRARLAGGEVAVIALLEVDADFVCGFHLKAVHRVLCFRYHRLIAAVHVSFSFFRRRLTLRRTAFFAFVVLIVHDERSIMRVNFCKNAQFFAPRGREYSLPCPSPASHFRAEK